MADTTSSLLAECKRIEEFSLWSATSHFVAAAWARGLHLLLGSIPLVLGAIGSWKPLSNPSSASEQDVLVAGIMTLLAGICGSLLSFWNLSRARMQHFTAATSYKSLENEARRAHEIHAIDDQPTEFTERVLDLAARYDHLGTTSVQSLDLAFMLAGKRIRKGRYAPDATTSSGGGS